MLLELHIKNMALIEKADMEFYNGLTVLSGETGAGKSILIDSINFALGAKIGKDIIRAGAEFAYVELLFSIEDEQKKDIIRNMGVSIDETGLIIISRKITQSKSIIRVNDEAFTVARLRELTSLLIDIHGQHEHQSLMNISKHLDIIDIIAGDSTLPIKEDIKKSYKQYKNLKEALSQNSDTYIREREIEILKYEIKEIETAKIRPNEEELLNKAYKKLGNMSKIFEAVNEVCESLDNSDIANALAYIADVSPFDKKLEEFENSLNEIQVLIEDLSHEVNSYRSGLEYNEDNFTKIEKRLDLVRKITSKYSDNHEELLGILSDKKKRLAKLLNYDNDRLKLLKELGEVEKELDKKCEELSFLRKNAADILKEEMIKHLKDLNFLGVKFDIEFRKLENFTQNGNDEAEFLISTNPGEPIKPLKEVASGGELSRIMLAFKTILAKKDEVDTLIFDEIDTGISGRTAVKVSEKLSIISKKHQVLCITHLPQIAAMADYNYLIEKSTDGINTHTGISYIKGDELTKELARLIGGSEITASVLNTALEMKTLADDFKKD